MSPDPRLLLWLAARGGRAAGRGTLWTVLVLVVQLLVALSAWGHDPRPHAVAPALTLSAQVVVQPPLGLPPGPVDAREAWPEGSRVQVSFQGAQDAWTAVVWLSGPTMAALYPDPARGQAGWTGTGIYAVPGSGDWLRLSRTPADGDTIAVVTAWAPVPAVQAALDDPSPGNVAALRSFLGARGGSWFAGAPAVERFLPTADGRAVPVDWRPLRGGSPLVKAWTIRSERGI
jgi:hypothetical protein